MNTLRNGRLFQPGSASWLRLWRALRRSGRVVALGAALALLAPSPGAGQSAADYQALKKEMDLLRQRLTELQKEVDALKARPSAANPAPAPAPALENIVIRLDKAPARGSATAKVMMVEVSDFECPFCGRFFAQTAPQIYKEYVETGKIRQAFVHLPVASHRFAFKAAEAAACASDQGKFWEMHDRLFSNQGALAANLLPGHADALGLNKDAFRSCLDGGKHAADVRSDLAMVNSAGATATPTFFLGTIDPKTRGFKVAKKIVGAKAFQIFKEAIDPLLTAS